MANEWKPSRERCDRFGLDRDAVMAMGPSCVYVIRGRGTDYWKVGLSTNVLQRLVNLEENTPFRLAVALLISSKDIARTERALLERVEEWQCRGEWHLVPAVELPFFAHRVDRGIRAGRGTESARGRAFGEYRAALEVADNCGMTTSLSQSAVELASGPPMCMADLVEQHLIETPFDHARDHLGRRVGIPDYWSL